MSETFDSTVFLKSLSTHPGVYRMYDSVGKLLYVGKAKNLKKRLSSYFRKNLDAIKTRAMVEKIRRIEVTVTASETEALLLEQTLIKENKPPYNILLRDDKSYPYIFLSDQKYPRLAYHRGAKKKKGQYFGPYPSAGAVRETMNLLEKIFKVRQCEDSFFRNRSRPCLQYQIERCTAPCVGYISPEEYAEDVRHTAMFLKGKTTSISEELAQKMEAASADLQFELAAQYRDQITAIRRVQEQQLMEADGGDVDVFGIAVQAGTACVQLVFVRGGRVIGFQRYFQKCQLEDEPAQILDAFLPQYYLGNRARDLPREVILPMAIESQEALSQAINESQGRKLTFSTNVRGHRAGWVKMATTNAEQNLSGHLADKENIYQRFESLQALLGLDDMPSRLECFDISHTQGEGTVASCVVFDHNGPVKSDYRRFNIEGITAGDDYAAMKQALQRRYTRLKKGEGKLPDILLIDGGKGQLTQAREVLEDLQVLGVTLVGVAKGVTRKAGLETLIVDGSRQEIQPRPDSPGLHLIQHIRDEAHRFAITAHRQRRSKARRTSPLEGITGVGPKRRRQLLNHFGGWQEVARASVSELAKVKGISQKVAEDIYAALHND
ncbi:MAG: excinuclease ABC subunit UvrC [Ketobacteraceae bacterium]|nr:excinuclease ABC subunit UvrC [Ketobacteraceae bacterium]